MPGSKPFFFVADGRRIVKPFLAEEIDKFYTMSAIMRGLIMRAPGASQLAVQRATIVSGPPRVRMSFVVRNRLKLYDDMVVIAMSVDMLITFDLVLYMISIHI